jgi:hypothetical protein
MGKKDEKQLASSTTPSDELKIELPLDEHFHLCYLARVSGKNAEELAAEILTEYLGEVLGNHLGRRQLL